MKVKLLYYIVDYSNPFNPFYYDRGFLTLDRAKEIRDVWFDSSYITFLREDVLFRFPIMKKHFKSTWALTKEEKFFSNSSRVNHKLRAKAMKLAGIRFYKFKDPWDREDLDRAKKGKGYLISRILK